jgi:hypothetical protein
MVRAPDKAKLVEIERDVEQAREIVDTEGNQGMQLSDMLEFVDFISNQLVYYSPDIKDRVGISVAELHCKSEYLDNAAIKGYIISIFAIILAAIKENLKEPDSS